MTKLKEDIKFLNLDYKKEITILCLITFSVIVLNIFSFIFLRRIYVSIMFLAGSMVFLFFYINRYSFAKEKIIRDREDEFVCIISYFEIFISNNFNVYKAFEFLIPYSSEWMKEEIKTLLRGIDEDKSVAPYVAFAKQFNNSVIENVMLSIYQMVEEGENSNQLTQFSIIFKDFSKVHKESALDKKTKSLDSMNIFPLIGAGFITIVLTFGILTVIGDMISGI